MLLRMHVFVFLGPLTLHAPQDARVICLSLHASQTASIYGSGSYGTCHTEFAGSLYIYNLALNCKYWLELLVDATSKINQKCQPVLRVEVVAECRPALRYTSTTLHLKIFNGLIKNF